MLIVHAGGLGDLVLSVPALASLRAAYADRHITLCCRKRFAGLCATFPFAFDRIIEIDFDPYVVSPLRPGHAETIAELLRDVRSDRAETLLSLELAPTWLTPAFAALLRPRVSLARALATLPERALALVLDRLELAPFAYDTYDAPDDAIERVRYDAILAKLGIDVCDATLVETQSGLAGAKTVIGTRAATSKTKASPLLACFPLGNRSVPLKRWPLDRHVAAIAAIAKERGCTPLLVGDESERDELTAIAARLRAPGVEAIVFAGDPHAFETLVSLLKRCAAFLANDTGLAHLAAALGVPGVTVYGGGTWPHFAPWANGTIGVVHPLPCFGCGWDCAFDRSLCLEAIETGDAIEALRAALDGMSQPVRVVLDRRSASERDTIALASATHRRVGAERAQTFEQMRELQSALREIRAVAGARLDPQEERDYGAPKTRA